MEYKKPHKKIDDKEICHYLSITRICYCGMTIFECLLNNTGISKIVILT